VWPRGPTPLKSTRAKDKFIPGLLTLDIVLLKLESTVGVTMLLEVLCAQCLMLEEMKNAKLPTGEMDNAYMKYGREF